MKLLDTTFLAHYYRGDPRTEAFLADRDDAEDEDLFTTTINLKEIAVGVHVVEDDPSLADVQTDFGWLRIEPFSAADAHRAAAIEARLRADESIQGDRLNALAGDILIAGVAENRDATVVTENAEDFELLGVPVETY